jgi:ABC-type molybdenum transport system ATPase subunit/photorepair protein PhrA
LEHETVILKHLAVRNFKQHTEVDQPLAGNIIAIIGRNGAGKSNLIGAVNFALSGEQPGFKREDLLQWGAVDGHVTLEFEHNGTTGKISRSLHNNSATFEFGNDEYRGIKKVGAALETLLGWDKDLGRQSVFVRQAEIDAILFEEARIRELAFQKLMGIGDAAKIHRKLGEVLSKVNVPQNYEQQLAEARRRHQDAAERLQALRQQLEADEAKRAQCPSVDALQARLTQAQHTQGLLQRLSELVEKIDRLQSQQLPGLKGQLTELSVPDLDLTAVDKEIGQLQALIRDIETWQQLAQEYRRAGEAVLALGDAPATAEAVAALEQEWRRLSTAYGAVQGKLKMHQELLSALQGGATEIEVCPLCGAEILDVEMLGTRLQNTINQLTQEAGGLDVHTAERSYRAQDAAVTQYATRRQALVEQYQRAKQALEAKPETQGDLHTLQARLQQLTEARQAAVTALGQKNQLEGQIRSVTESITQLDQEHEQLVAQVKMTLSQFTIQTLGAALKQVTKDIPNLQCVIGDAQELDRQLAHHHGTIQELEKVVTDNLNTITLLEERQSKQGDMQAALTVLGNVRDWFHYSNGPHTMASAVVDVMTEDVNRYLGHFAAPFTVTPSAEALGYIAHFHDGRPQPPDGADTIHLSGGQRIQLALSFRFAAYSMFANKLGLLSLDEPTVHLDTFNVARFCTMMERVKRVTHDMGLQVLISTHAREVIQFADTVIDLSQEDTVHTETVTGITGNEEQ